MTLDEAVAILRRHDRGDRGLSLHDWTAASAFVHSYYSHEGKHLMRPANTRDARLRFQDQPLPFGPVGEGVTGAVGSTQSVRTAGPRRVLKLNGPASSYSIVSTTGGEVWLVQHSNISGIAEGMTEGENRMGSTQPLSGDDLTKQRYAALDASKARMKVIADGYKAFWHRGAA